MRPSQALYRLGQKGLRWMPLVLALEWTEAHRADAQHTAPAPELFREFLDLLSKTTHDEAQRAPE
jgi:hypothetical protein